MPQKLLWNGEKINLLIRYNFDTMGGIAVLGAGRVGNAIVQDLSEKHPVTAFDIDPVILNEIPANENVQTRQVDLRDTDFMQLLDGFELVINAVPGFMGYETLRKIITCKKNVVDISFFPEDPMDLDQLARSQKICAVVDCGVAPGMGNIILGRYNEIMDIQSYVCFVGGLPSERTWPYQYKAGFSPVDVIEEYVRPARYVVNRKQVIKEALSDPELIHFDKVGSLEAFNTDGLRTLIHTMDIPDMIEKTLRYPGSIEPLRILRESGFFSDDPVDIQGVSIKPVEFTSKLLFPLWNLRKEEEDITVMRITMKGNRDSTEEEVIYDLFDVKDSKNGISSMARTTGYTCTAVANLILEGKYHQEGINPPEYLGRDPDNFSYIINYLKSRNVVYTKTVKSE